MKKTYPVIDHGEGVYLYDTLGRRYLDGAGGMYVVNISHGVSEILVGLGRGVVDRSSPPADTGG